jgi:hypothetical protein
MMGQIYPGCKYPLSSKDGCAARAGFFKNCLDKMSFLEGSFAFPWRVGCGAAGGAWYQYLEMIKDFSDKVKDVTIYRLSPPAETHQDKTLF